MGAILRVLAAFAIRLRWFCTIVFAGRAARFALVIAATVLARR